MKDLCIGIALGSGAARGWAHIGVLRALAETGIEPNVVCGTSAGALVGGAYVAGHMDDLEQWLCTLSRLDVARFFDISFASGGLIAGKRIISFFRERFGDFDIQSLPRPFGAVATELETGREVWFRSGSLLDAVRASFSVPGIFEPIQLAGKWYVDGGVVNPVPVSLCRALGAELVIAVDVNSIKFTQPATTFEPKNAGNASGPDAGGNSSESSPLRLKKGLKDRMGETPFNLWRGNKHKPGLLHVLNNSAHFMQERITRSRLACDPPDFTLAPNTWGIGFMDFHRAEETIEVGKLCVYKNKDELTCLIDS